jgi:hypothetical protein
MWALTALIRRISWEGCSLVPAIYRKMLACALSSVCARRGEAGREIGARRRSALSSVCAAGRALLCVRRRGKAGGTSGRVGGAGEVSRGAPAKRGGTGARRVGGAGGPRRSRELGVKDLGGAGRRGSGGGRGARRQRRWQR